MNQLPPLSLGTGLIQFRFLYMPSRNLAKKTQEEYTRDVEDLIGFLKNQGIEEWSQVGLENLQAYMAYLEGQALKITTRNRKAYAIKTFFKYLAGGGYVIDNAAEALIPPKVPKQEPRFLSTSEYTALLDQITDTRDRAIVMLFLQAGLLLSELAKLEMDDVQLPDQVAKDAEHVGVIKVERKDASEEYLPLNWKACEALTAWFVERRNKLREKATSTQAVFVNKFGESISARSIQRMVKKYLEQAGIEDASVHTLRHTMATHYVAKGGDIKSIQEMLDHANLGTTQGYLELAKKAQIQMVQNLAL